MRDALRLSDRPIVAAPMAGGVSTLELIRAVHGAGGFAFLPAGYKSPAALEAEISALQADGIRFGVNLFVPDGRPVDPAAYARYRDALAPLFVKYGLVAATSHPREDDDSWSEKLALLRRRRVEVVSTTFGLPSEKVVTSLQRAGTRVLATVTTVLEALASKDRGVDGLVVQGSDAGGHSGTHDPARAIVRTATAPLVAAVAAAAQLPIVAAGGVAGPESVRELIRAGAESVAIGTLLLRSFESGASTVHKDALADPSFQETVITRAFTGRPARALKNGFIERFDELAPVGYPAVHFLTQPVRRAAAFAGERENVHLWAGTGFRNAREDSARAIVEWVSS